MALPTTTKRVTDLDEVVSPSDDAALAIESPGAVDTKKITVANLRAAMKGADTELLWEWNGEDTTQFGAPRSWQRDLGGSSGTLALSVVTAARNGRPALRLSAAGLSGGLYAPIDVDLPKRYVVAYTIIGVSGDLRFSAFVLFGSRSGAMRGLVAARNFSSSAANVELHRVVNDRPTVSGLSGSGAPATVATLDRGGMRTVADVTRPAGEAPALWHVGMTERAATSFPFVGATQASHPPSTPTDWDERDLAGVGPGVLSLSGGGSAPVVDYQDIRIYTWPGPLG